MRYGVFGPGITDWISVTRPWDASLMFLHTGIFLKKHVGSLRSSGISFSFSLTFTFIDQVLQEGLGDG